MAYLRSFVFFVVLGSIFGVSYGQPSSRDSDILGRYSVQPDVWRPVTPVEPGVNANGDLNLSLPIMTVPGRGGLDFPISLTYRSGIALSQASSWVGLGWSFDPGSIVRDVQGKARSNDTDPSEDVDFGTIQSVQPDQYFVTTPWGGFTMSAGTSLPSGNYNTRGGSCGGMYMTEWSPWRIDCAHAQPLTVSAELSNGSTLATTASVVRGGSTVNQNEFSSFTLTSPDGTRFVFARPTLATYDVLDMNLGQDAQKFYVNTWRLMAVLSVDFVSSNPMVPNPTTPSVGASSGNWIELRYTPVVAMTGFTLHQGGVMQSTYLESIRTPTHLAVFQTNGKSQEIINESVTSHPDFSKSLSSITLCAVTESLQNECPIENWIRKVSLPQSEKYIGYDGNKSQNVKRWFLDGLNFSGNTGVEESFQFEYYDGQFPGVNGGNAVSWEKYIDEFGYPNFCDNSTEPYQCLGSTEDGKVWSLKSIRYPTGGYSVVEYENDRIASQGADVSFTFSNESSSSPHIYHPEKLKQGGARVTRIRRYAYKDGPETNSSEFDYRASDSELDTETGGYVSAVPSGFWTRGTYAYYTRLQVYDRRAAAVYYKRITEIRSDGTKRQSCYYVPSQSAPNYPCELPSGSSFDFADASPTAQIFYAPPMPGSPLIKGASVVQDNRYILWGIKYGEHDTREGGRSSTQAYNILGAPAITAFVTAGSTIKVYWRRDQGPVASRVVTPASGEVLTYHSYDALLRKRSDSTALFSGGFRVKRTTYATSYYSGLDSKNQLGPVAREDVLHYNGGTLTVHGSSTTTWSNYGTSTAQRWYPARSYVWTGAANAGLPAFSSWTGGAPAADWALQSENLTYDTRGHVRAQLDARGARTDLTYDDETQSQLMEVKRSASGLSDHQWSIAYDPVYGKVASVTDATGTSVFRRFEYDSYGRLFKVLDGGGVELLRHAYFLAGAAYAPGAPSYVRTSRTSDAAGALVTTEFLDGWGRKVQTQEQDGSADIVVATRYDSHGRPSQTWNPGRIDNASHAYVRGDTAAVFDRDGATGRPYAEQTYDALSRPSSAYVQTLSPQAGAFRKTRYGYLAGFDLDGTLQGGTWKTVEVDDEEGRRSLAATDALGREVLRRQQLERPAPVGTPLNFTVKADTTCPVVEQMAARTTASVHTNVPRQPQGRYQSGDSRSASRGQAPVRGEMAPMSEDYECTSSRTHTFTVPEPMLVSLPYSIKAVGYHARADVRILGTEGIDASVVATQTFSPSQQDSLLFLAQPGITYTAEAKVQTVEGYFGDAEAKLTVKFRTASGNVLTHLDTRFVYDAMDRLVASYPPHAFEVNATQREALATRYVYDTRGLVTEKTTPDGGTEKYRYDRSGLLRFAERQSDRNASTGATKRYLYFKYDAYGRETESGLYSGTTAFASADPNSDAFPASGTLTERVVKAYDARPTAFPFSNVPSSLPNPPAGNLLGRLAAVASESGSPAEWRVVRFAYDARTELVSRMVARTSSDVAGGAVEMLGRSYDRQGLVLTDTTKRQVSGVPQQRVQTYAYNARGLLASVTTTTTPTTGTASASFTYKPSGSLATKTLGTTLTPYTYDERLRLTGIGSLAGSGDTTAPFSAAYGYSVSSRLVTWQQSHRGSQRYQQTFTYDTIGRLAGADFSSWSGSAYTASSAYDLSAMQYDKSGNILALVRNGQSGTAVDALAYAYTNGTNRLNEVTDATSDYQRGASYGYYTYDADGAVSRIDGSGPTHDDLDTDLLLDRRKLPVVVSRWDVFSGVTTSVGSRYSASGERYAKAITDDGGSSPMSERVVLGWAGASGREAVAGVFTGTTGNVLRYWTVTTPSGEVLGRVLPGSGGVRYYGKDHLGSVRSVVDGSGVVKERHDYDAWGGELEGRSVVESATGRERYTGHQWDGETSWLYAGARMYDPFVGRWLGRDRLSERYAGLSPYLYAAGAPTMYFDADGDSVYVRNTHHVGLLGFLGIGRSVSETAVYRNGSWYVPGTNNSFHSKNRNMNMLMKNAAEGIGMINETGSIYSGHMSDVVGSSSKNIIIKYGANQTSGPNVRINGINTLPNSLLREGTGSMTTSAGLIAAHEIGHALNNIFSISSSSEFSQIPEILYEFPNGKIARRSEVVTVHIENMIRSKRGMALREYYGINDGSRVVGLLQQGANCASLYPGNPCY